MPSVTTIKPGRTCDNCRKRKIKCVEDEQNPTSRPCTGCQSLGINCTHDYVRKKPGRKNHFAEAMKAAQSGDLSQGNPADIYPRSVQPQSQPYQTPSLRTPVLGLPLLTPNTTNSDRSDQTYTYETKSSFSPSDSFNSRSMSSSFASRSGTESTGLSWLDSVLDPATNSFGMISGFADPLGMGSFNGFGDMMVDSQTGLNTFPSEQAQLLSLESPPNMLGGLIQNGLGGRQTQINDTVTPEAGRMDSASTIIGRREPQLEDVASWTNISHYISLFLQYLYPLLPLVHRPTFAENLATRMDLRDTDFRALLLSIVAYTISQLPTSRLLNDQYDIEGLKRLQRRCHRTSQALQRTYHGTINLTQICIIIFDNFYLVSIGLSHTAAARLGVAVQLAFSMGMHSDAKTAALGLDCVEVQLRRRVFWQLYCSDKTRAIPGHPMLINDFQGLCSYPEPTDDDFITTQGLFPQPPHRTSLLAGFISVCQIFKVLSESFFHHRCLISEITTIGKEWTVEAEDRVHRVLREMPAVIQEPGINRTEAARRVFAMQRANILITAAIAKFALYDLRAALHVDEEQLARERETIAREIHSLLMNIPVEDLASNGESVRAKVFHIACALCTQVPANDTDQELIKDWCNMFSAITFVQMPPPPPDVAADSRANSPPPTVSMKST